MSASTNGHERATLIHELGHVSQHQHGVSVIARGILERDHDDLPMTASSEFDRHGIEEQARIFRDHFHIPNRRTKPEWPDGSVYVAVHPVPAARWLGPLLAVCATPALADWPEARDRAADAFAPMRSSFGSIGGSPWPWRSPGRPRRCESSPTMTVKDRR